MLAEGAFHQHLEALKAEYERLVAENEQLRRAPGAPDSPPQPRTEPLAVPPPLEPPPFAAPALLGAETAGAEGAKSWSQALQDEVAVTKALGLNERPLGLVALEAMAILVTCGALLLGGWLTKEGYRSAAEWGLEITFTVFFVFEGILRCYYAEREDSWWGSQLNGMNYAGGLVSLFNAGRGSWSAWLLVVRALRLRRFKLARQLKKWMGGGREAEFLWLTADFFLFLYLLAIIVTKYYTNLSVEEMLDVGAGMFLAFRCFMGDFHNVGPAKLDQEDVLFWVPFLVILIPTVLLGVGCIARVIVALCMPDAKDQSIGVKKLLAMMSQVCVKLNIDVPALP